MIFHFRKWMTRFRFMLLFVAFTFMMYHVLLLINYWIEPKDKYREPAGQAVKAFHNHHVSVNDSSSSMGERLKLFYWIGE